MFIFWIVIIAINYKKQNIIFKEFAKLKKTYFESLFAPFVKTKK